MNYTNDFKHFYSSTDSRMKLMKVVRRKPAANVGESKSPTISILPGKWYGCFDDRPPERKALGLTLQYCLTFAHLENPLWRRKRERTRNKMLYFSSRSVVQLSTPKSTLETSITISNIGLIILNIAKELIPAIPNTRSDRKTRAIKPETTSPVRHKILGIHYLEERHETTHFRPDGLRASIVEVQRLSPRF